MSSLGDIPGSREPSPDGLGPSGFDPDRLPTPAHEPLGDLHHCDVPFAPEDEELGDRLAYFMGTLYSDIGCGGKEHLGHYFYSVMTPVEEWSRVARALRVHGLKIVEA